MIIVNFDQLGNIDFGSSDYYSNEQINISLNLKKIYTIEYKIDPNDNNVVGTINNPDFFVYSNTIIGKLDEDGSGNPIITTDGMVLGTPDVTRENFDLMGWSTSALDSDTTATKYDVGTTLTDNQLKAIVNSLMGAGQTYTLYVDWAYKNVNIYIYALADIVNNPAGEDTTLVDPYSYYLDANNDGSDIPFSNVAKFIYVDGQVQFFNNYDFNKSEDTKVAQIRYNSTFVINPKNIELLTRKEREQRQINGWWCLEERLQLDHVGY